MKIYNVVRVIDSSSEGINVTLNSFDSLEKAKINLKSNYDFDIECEEAVRLVDKNFTENKYWIECIDEFGKSSVDCEIFETELE